MQVFGLVLSVERSVRWQVLVWVVWRSRFSWAFVGEFVEQIHVHEFV